MYELNYEMQKPISYHDGTEKKSQQNVPLATEDYQ